jgi:signal transduction histidine kinase
MGRFIAGLVVGLIVAGVILGIAGIRFYRRFLALQQRARQAERLAELGVLTGGLAHEIRNPLSTVQLNLQLLAEELETDGTHNRLRPRLATVQSETSRLRDILDDFLRYAGKIELNRSDVDLHQLLVEMADFFAPQAQLNRVRLRVAEGSQKVMANLDPRLVRQAVLNLMINANQAMMNGGGEIILRASSGENEAIIDVIDTGPGIEPAELDRIFQAYYSRRAGGSGLGLAMTRRIAEEHGGQVTVRSEPGKGSQFTLHFPARPGVSRTEPV